MKTATWIKISPLILLSAILLVPSALCDSAHGDGQLSLYYDARKETLDVRFRTPRGEIIPAAMRKIAQFLRSPDNETHSISPQLLDLVDAIQDHFHEPVIEIISGYRSPSYNRGLKETGHAVANESLHTQGLAIDIHLDTVTEEAVRDYAQSLNQGGVGWYPQNDFVHVDLGPVRTWGHAERERKWVGLNNNLGSFVIRSNANRYFYKQSLQLDIRPGPVTGDFALDLSPLKQSDPHHGMWTLERFDRGNWKVAHSGTSIGKNATIHIPASTLDLLARGRYRLRFVDSLSNEFYLKK